MSNGKSEGAGRYLTAVWAVTPIVNGVGRLELIDPNGHNLC